MTYIYSSSVFYTVSIIVTLIKSFLSAVVGRVVKFFGAPLITTGGFTFDFTEKKVECKDEYFMTTRIGSLAFRDIAKFFMAIMDRYVWFEVIEIKCNKNFIFMYFFKRD